MQPHPPPDMIDDLIDEEIDESFPASDPPSFSGMHAGTPCPELQQAEEANGADPTT
jgi:hypothetical protein